MDGFANFFDVVFLSIAVFLALLGFWKGAGKEIFSTLGVYCGLLAAGRFYGQYYPVAETYIENTAVAKMVAYLGILGIGTAAGIALTLLLGVMLNLKNPSLSSRLFGGILGGSKALAISVALFFIAREYLPAFSDELEPSRIAPYLQNIWLELNGMGFA